MTQVHMARRGSLSNADGSQNFAGTHIAVRATSAYLAEYTKGMGGCQAVLVAMTPSGRRREVAQVSGNGVAYSLAAELIDGDRQPVARVDGTARWSTDLAWYQRAVSRQTALRLLRLARATRRLLPRASRMRPSEQEAELRAAIRGEA